MALAARIEWLAARALRAVVHVLVALFRLLASRRAVGGPPRPPPPASDPLLRLSAVRLAERIRRKEVTSVQVVRAYIERIQEVNPLVNAVVKDRFSAALQEAARADRLVEEDKGDEGVLKERLPLLGVPFTVKESFCVQGMPNSAGLLSRRGVVSGTDAPAVALLKKAGAIPLAVTNCSELCMWLESHNHLYGITRNPYDTRRIPGGSSGGEGSILASGGSVVGVGSDIGGSIRMPAFFNGIFGHKPTPGIVSNDGQHPPSSGRRDEFLCTGPMCRYAEDLLPLLSIMAGKNADKLSLHADVDLRKLRYFSVPHNGGSPLVSPVERQLIEAQKKVVRRLEADLGVTVQEVPLPQLRYSHHIWLDCMASPNQHGELPVPFAELMGDGSRKVWPLWELLKWLLGRSPHTLPAIGLALVDKVLGSQPSRFIGQQKEQLQVRVEQLLGSDGVLLYPPHPRVAPEHHVPVFTPFDFSYTGVFNILGLPVTQCPLGLGEQRLPLGVQVVAGKLQDRLCLAVARHLERAFGGWRDPGAP
ncbi:fatty-acid amide hydrolase 2-A-like [Scleropages formosus]|nr:fatty-acid amide hydrolase 2 [Scleropages formosus]